ncbi:hypothetical protein DLM46_08755 [Paraburkholderia lacunae]|uniref:Uncharacterized protein n=1 Tax=Paraburkholderia lacunae TaxID=2211104 RepID=A0A370NCA0_9BURK|nr:hypothetical protein DLM46_08755 [Paraburkholderia lacunae]
MERAGTYAELLPSARDLEPHAWDALVADSDFFHCRGWLNGLDTALGPTTVLTLHGSAGLLGGCALWDGETAPGFFCLPEFFPDVPGPWDGDFLWIGARRSTHNEIPCVVGQRRGGTLTKLLHSALALAERRGRTGIVVPYMPLAKALELACADERGRVLLHSAEARINVPSGGLQEMMGLVGTRHRWRTRDELSTFARKGNRVEWTPLTSEIEEIAARLIAQNRSKHGSSQGVEWMRRMFAGQRQSGVIKNAIAAVAYRRDQAVAVSVFYRFGQTLHLRYFGSDYAVDDNDFRYFVLCYYDPLDYAAARGISQYHLSTSSLQAKSLRGALVEPLAAVVLSVDGDGPERDDVDRHNRQFTKRFRQQFASRLSPDWSLIQP